MSDFEKTSYYAQPVSGGRGALITVFDGAKEPYTVNLDGFGKSSVFFGRDPRNDIVLTSPLASGEHGRFVKSGSGWAIEDKVVYRGTKSTNGLTYNNAGVYSHYISDGDFFRIDISGQHTPNGVLMVASEAGSPNSWAKVPTSADITVGRDSSCNIVLPHITVSKLHARITASGGGHVISDCNSTNGVIVNNRRIAGNQPLSEKDVITITNTKLIYTYGAVYYCCYRGGISVDASNVYITRGRGAKAFVTCRGVSLNIRPGELVGIIGGSGAGKSTILNAMCGYLRPASGEVYINGVDLYRNFDSLKKLIGYVPQSDIVYGDLTLHDMLMYTAKLRLPDDTSYEEREAAISKAIETVELGEKRDSLIRALSGGQRKRASIAVELLSDPNLLFLDEPASGLDPGTERSLMTSLRRMADGGKTVILVTHSTLQLQKCDKIVFMGRGGNLCFCGSYGEALKFFGVKDIVDVYQMMNDQAEYWSEKYRSICAPAQPASPSEDGVKRSPKHRIKQLFVLSMRYLKLIVNDRQRLILLLLQAPVLIFLVALVADGDQFEEYEMTKSLLFALSCSAFWVGMLNALQEICKERSILKREYMTGLSLTSYVLSKIFVLGLVCVIQSLLISAAFTLLIGISSYTLIAPAFIEMFLTTFFTSLAASAMGLLVSSLFTNADRVMSVAPVLLMPQILFSGLIFELDGLTEGVSLFTLCRWSMEGYGTSANLNEIPMFSPGGYHVVRETEDFFEFTAGHLVQSWLILLLFTAAFIISARIVLTGIRRDGQ